MLMKFEGQSFSSPVLQILSTEETNAVLLWSSSYSDFNTARRAVPIARAHPSLLLTPQMLNDVFQSSPHNPLERIIGGFACNLERKMYLISCYLELF